MVRIIDLEITEITVLYIVEQIFSQLYIKEPTSNIDESCILEKKYRSGLIIRQERSWLKDSSVARIESSKNRK